MKNYKGSADLHTIRIFDSDKPAFFDSSCVWKKGKPLLSDSRGIPYKSILPFPIYMAIEILLSCEFIFFFCPRLLASLTWRIYLFLTLLSLMCTTYDQSTRNWTVPTQLESFIISNKAVSSLVTIWMFRLNLGGRTGNRHKTVHTLLLFARVYR